MMTDLSFNERLISVQIILIEWETDLSSVETDLCFNERLISVQIRLISVLMRDWSQFKD